MREILKNANSKETMDKIHERHFRLLLKNYKDAFQDLLRSSGDITIHQRCINSLLAIIIKLSLQMYY